MARSPFVRGIGDCGLDFFEQPVSAHDLDGMSRIAAATKVPIGADEGIHSLDDIARHHERKAARGVSLKAIKLGGLSGLFAASRLCGQLGMQLNISCKTGETSLASAAAVHLAAVAPALAWGLTMTIERPCRGRHCGTVARRRRPCRSAGAARTRHRRR